MTKKLPKDEVEVPVEFPKAIDIEIFLKLILDLAKNLLLVKNQIPLQYDAIAKEVDLAEKQKCDLDEDEEEVEGIPSREHIRNRQMRARARRSKLQLVKNGRKLIDDLNDIERVIREELVNDNVEKISFVFGATVHSAREVYSVPVPDTLSQDSQHPSSRFGLHLFRAMMSHETLHQVTDIRLPVSNMYVVLSRRSSCSSTTMVHIPEFELPSLSRCSRVNFKFIFPETTATKLATRRLRFTSGADNHFSNDPLLRQPLETPYTNQNMVMCTPHIGHDRQRSRFSQVDNLVLSTPAPVLRQSHTLGVPSHSMDLCTPAVNKIHSKLDIQTPSCNKLPSSMEMCTPAVNHLPSSMELCTPANNNIQYSMEMCTPMVQHSLVRTLRGNHETRNSGSMEMCTPETLNSSVSKFQNFSQDSFQLQTPLIENLSLLSPNKKTKISHESEEQDLKDSGICSPDLSRRVVESNKELNWFLLESSIRGFKYKHY